MKYLAHLGRQPELGLAELESQISAAAIKPFSEQACLIDKNITLNRFGGVIRFAEVLAEGRTADWQPLLKQQIDLLAEALPDNFGKLKLGFSLFGVPTNVGQLNRTALDMKKRLKTKGHSVRVIPNKQLELNAAQVLYNKLTDEKGVELTVFSNGETVIIARTLAVQDIDAYARRDRDKPVRDPEVGMLPPKLAQILINLSGKNDGRLLDPFSGTGTLLMEASLLGFSVYGSDIAPRMSQATKKNLQWLAAQTALQLDETVETADATKHNWQPPIDCVVAETYLGPPLHALPEPSSLQKIITQIDQLHRAFLENIAPQLESGTPLVLAVPAWKSKSGRTTKLPMVDDLEKMGYNPIRFEYVVNELIYARHDQVVARQILVMIRK